MPKNDWGTGNKQNSEEGTSSFLSGIRLGKVFEKRVD